MSENPTLSLTDAIIVIHTAFEQLPEESRSGVELAFDLVRNHALGLVKSIDPPATSAEALAARFSKTYKRELSAGVWVEIRKLSLSAEILKGTLPNYVLKNVVFEGDSTANLFSDPDDEVTKRQSQYEAYLPILARGFVNPKFVFDVPRDLSKGETGPQDYTHVELGNAYYYIVREVVPPVESAPFSNGTNGEQGASST
jgi:hypothetical protein